MDDLNQLNTQPNEGIPQEPIQPNQWNPQQPVQPNQWNPQQPVQPNQWDTQQTAQKTPKKKRTLFIIAACVALAAILGAAGIFAYAQFSPEKKLARCLTEGDKYLDELDYERALASYQAALEIEPKDLDAHLGIIEASYYLDSEDLSDVYTETLDVIATLNEDQLSQNSENISAIYEWSFYVYPDDLEKIVSILEDGYALNPNNDSIKELLIKAYNELSDAYYQYGYYEDMFDILNRWESLEPSNTSIAVKFSDGLSEYLNALVNEGSIDTAADVINEHFDVATKIILSPALTAMENNDIETMTTIDGAALTNALVTAIDKTPCIFTADGPVNNYTGMALGVYPYGEGAYYFYYGNYINGSREGQGSYFIKSNQTYCRTFVGNWENDKPNGIGTITGYGRAYEGAAYNSLYVANQTGTFINGIGNGPFSCDLYDYSRNLLFTGSFTADNGVVADLYEDYPTHHNGGEFDDMHYSGKTIYIVFTNPTTGYIWFNSLASDTLFGLSGFTE